jgi:hypothetical protein
LAALMSHLSIEPELHMAERRLAAPFFISARLCSRLNAP